MRKTRQWVASSVCLALWVLPLMIVAGGTEASAAMLVKVQGVRGSSQIQGYDDGTWFVADSFSFGVDRELKESGEKGGTQDINIGVGEVQELTLNKSLDIGSMDLMQFSLNGNSMGSAEIHFVEIEGETGKAFAYLVIKLDRAFVKSWSTSGDADDRPTEEVALVFNKIALVYRQRDPRGGIQESRIASWDLAANKPWTDSGISFPR